MTEIVRSENVLGGEPRIEGTRIGVFHVQELVVQGNHAPVDVADQLGLSLAEVYTALAYYYEHADEMQRVREAHDAAADKLAQESLSRPEPAN